MELIVLQWKTVMQQPQPLLCIDTFRSCQETKAHLLPESWKDSITTSPVASRNLPQTTTENHNFIVIKIDDMISNFIYYREHRSGSRSNNTQHRKWKVGTYRAIETHPLCKSCHPKTTPSFTRHRCLPLQRVFTLFHFSDLLRLFHRTTIPFHRLNIATNSCSLFLFSPCTERNTTYISTAFIQ